MINMRILDKVCEKCMGDSNLCPALSDDIDCCIMELKMIDPDADPEFIFFYCCILQCGFNKHRCDSCLITKSGIIKFVKEKQVEDPMQKTLSEFSESGVGKIVFHA